MFNIYFESKQIVDFLSDQKVSSKVINKAKSLNKLNELYSFFNKTMLNMNQFDKVIINELNTLNVKDLTNCLNDLGSCKNPKELMNKLQNFSDGYKGEFFNISYGIGRGEILCAWLLKDAILTGTAVNYDVISNKINYEIKSEMRGNSFRLGTTDVISKYDIWDVINHTIKKCYKNKDKLLNINYIHKKGKLTLSELTQEIINVSTDVKKGAFTKNTINKFDWFYYTANEYTKSAEGNNSYSRMILRGQNIKQTQINIQPIEQDELNKVKETGGKLEIQIQQDIEEKNEITGELRDLIYVRHPENFRQDLNNAIKDTMSDRVFIFFKGMKVLFYSKNQNYSNIKDIELDTITNLRMKVKLIE